MTKLRRLKVRLVCLIYVNGFVVAGKTGRVMSNRQRYFTVDEALAQLLQEEDEDFYGEGVKSHWTTTELPEVQY